VLAATKDAILSLGRGLFQYNMNFLFGNILPKMESALILQISIAYMPVSDTV
jgi:hypothetical protein